MKSRDMLRRAHQVPVFLLLKECVVILTLSKDRRCIWGSLYLDEHGEEDPNLRRGRALYLSKERLNALLCFWVSDCTTVEFSKDQRENGMILTSTRMNSKRGPCIYRYM